MASGRRAHKRSIAEIVAYKVRRYDKAIENGNDEEIIEWAERMKAGSVHHKI